MRICIKCHKKEGIQDKNWREEKEGGPEKEHAPEDP